MTGAPGNPPRGEFPKVSGAGFANPDGSNQRATVRSSEGSAASRRRLGRSDPAGNAFVVFAVVVTVKAGPDSAVSITPIFQPPTMPLRTRLPLNFGASYSA